MTATIPFDFTVGDKTLPAGTYTVEAINSHGLLVMRSEDYTQGILIMTGAMQAKREPEPAQLIFRKYGDLYFLAEVWGYNEASRSAATDVPALTATFVCAPAESAAQFARDSFVERPDRRSRVREGGRAGSIAGLPAKL